MKKNIRKIPQSLLLKLKGIKANSIVVGCAKTFSEAQLKQGVLSHLGITLNDKGLLVPDVVLPDPKKGKYSYYNIHGEEVIRKDLPKETHYRTIQAPNWGDSWKGTHDVNIPYEKFPRELKAPMFARIKIESPGRDPGKAAYIIKFELDAVLDRMASDFMDKLIKGLNILQENVGACGIEASGAGLAEYIKGLRVSWEILPPGTKEEIVAYLSRKRALSEMQQKTIEDRYDVLMSFKPLQMIYGTSGFQRYFGAQIKENLVVFENIEYGNAIYVIYEDWEELSKRSRLELLSGKFGKNFDRIIHNKGWKKELKGLITSKMSPTT